MDQKTIDAYDRAAGDFAADWHAQPTGSDLRETVGRFFAAGAPTADIGCGSGREVAWLNAEGFAAVGYDASAALVAEARRRYPGLSFAEAMLPELAGIADARFGNVLCETVIMHLDPQVIAPSVARLAAILKPGGTLYLTWRTTEGQDQRDAHGRLYAAFDKALVLDALRPAAILLDEALVSASSGKPIHRIVARKAAARA